MKGNSLQSPIRTIRVDAPGLWTRCSHCGEAGVRIYADCGGSEGVCVYIPRQGAYTMLKE